MSATRKKQSKAERIELRVTPNTKALLQAAANVKHTTISEFLLDNGIAAAEDALTTPKIFYLSEEGWNAVQRLLDEDETTPLSPTTLEWLKQRRWKD